MGQAQKKTFFLGSCSLILVIFTHAHFEDELYTDVLKDKESLLRMISKLLNPFYKIGVFHLMNAALMNAEFDAVATI